MLKIIVFSDHDDREFSKMLIGFSVKYSSDYDDGFYFYYFETTNKNEIELIYMILNQCEIEFKLI